MAQAQMSIYDYAKQVIANEVPMDAIAANIKFLDMADYIHHNDYTMLLCRERNDYTVFSTSFLYEQIGKKNIENTAKELRETITNRGILLLADKQKDGNYEIWIRDKETNENFCYYLFDYTFGVVEV